MQVNQTFKKAIPHFSAILIFITVSAIYFYPQFNGYDLKQHDIEQFIGMSKEIADYRTKYNSEPLWTNSAFAGMPAYQISVRYFNPVNTLKGYILKLLPGTFGYIFLMMIGFYILLLCFDVNPWVAIIVSIAFGFSSFNILYLVGGHNAKVHALSFIPPMVGSIVYAYRKNFFIGAALLSVLTALHLSANHVQMTYYMLFMLFMIVLFQFFIFLKNKEILKFFKISVILIFAGILGAIPTIPNLIITEEYGNYSTRGKSELTNSDNNNATANDALDRDYIKQHSLGNGEVWSIAVPNIKGGAMGYIGQYKDIVRNVKPAYREMVSQQSSYWGEQYTSGGAFYYGASIFLLFVLGLFFIKDKMKWVFFAVSLLAVILSLKYSKITDLFIQYFPLFNKFRDTKMMLVLVQISFPLLGALFLNHIMKNKVDIKKILYVVGSLCGVFLLFYSIPTVWFDFLNKSDVQQFNDLLSNYRNNPEALNQIKEYRNEIIQARIGIFRKDTLRSLFFIFATGIIIYMFLVNKIKQKSFLILLGFLILIDLWAVDKRYLNNEKKGSNYKQWVKSNRYLNPFIAAEADNEIFRRESEQNPIINEKIKASLVELKKGKKSSFSDEQTERDKIRFRELNYATNYRVLFIDNPFSEARASYFHKSLGGYHGAKLKNYQELIDYHLFPEHNKIFNTLKNQFTSDRLDSMLKYDIPVMNMLNTKYLIYNNSSQLIENPYHFGNAWYVNNVKVVNNANEEIKFLKNIDRNTIVLQEKYKNQLPKVIVNDSIATIDLVSYNPNHLVYETKTRFDQVAVFSEIFYPAGWNVYLDNQKTTYFKANYAFRAMKIPEGVHKIEFKFEPKSFNISNNISKAGSGLMLVFILSFVWIDLKNKKKKTIIKLIN